MDDNLIVGIIAVILGLIGIILSLISLYKQRQKVVIEFGVPGTIHALYPGYLKKINNELLVPMEIINKGGTDITITNFTFHWKNDNTYCAIFPNEKDFFS